MTGELGIGFEGGAEGEGCRELPDSSAKPTGVGCDLHHSRPNISAGGDIGVAPGTLWVTMTTWKRVLL